MSSKYTPITTAGAVGIIFIMLILTATNAFAQPTLRGRVTDADNGEVLIGATLYNPTTGRGYTTNSYGFFTIPSVRDSITLRVSYMGYETLELGVDPSQSPIHIQLTPGATQIEGVVVSGITSRAPTHGQHTISRMDLRSTPVLMAEKDVLKTIQLLPGIQRNSEGTSGFSVRGGSHDQNLMLIDGIPVYNINHLWGFVSVFNTDAVNSVNFYKGGIPASYGGRLSSVVDVMLREGNPDRYTGSVSVGLISTKFTFEGPLQKEKSSFLLAGRRTMYDLLISPVIYATHDFMPGYYFQDYTLKLNHRVNPNNTLFLSSYLGNDKVYLIGREEDEDTGVRYMDRYDMGWGNITTAFRWNNTSIPNVFSNVTVAYTHFRYLVSNKYWDKHPDSANDESAQISYYSGVNDVIARWSLSYYGIEGQQINTGVEHTWHVFNPGVNHERIEGYGYEEDFSVQKGEYIPGQEFNAYVDNRFSYGIVSGNLGMRYTLFSVGERNYNGWQPRALLEVGLTDRTSIFAGYNRMFQHLHLVSNSNLGMPTDLWLPISEVIPPQQADQFSVGARFDLGARYQLTMEAYTKEMDNLTDYRDGIVLNDQSTNWDHVLTLGRGHSRGVELMLERSHGALTGWATYTLAWTDRTFDEINSGESFPFQYDRRHGVNLFVAYRFSPTQSVSVSWVASSGHWMTVNHDNYMIGRMEILNLSNRNNYRLSPHHHLDISYTSSKEKRRGTRSWVFGVYNVYANHNTFMISRQNPNTFDYDPRYLSSVSIFPIMPFVAWEYVFN